MLLRDKWWRQDCGPLIAYTAADNRPVALLPVSANRYHLFDPIHRTRIPVNERVASTLTPVAHTLYRSLPNRVLKATDLLRFALKGRLKDVFAIVLTGIAVTLLGMLVPQATAISIDSAIPDSDRGLLLQVGLGLLVAAIVTAAFRTSQGLAILRLETGSDASTQAAVWDRLLNLPVSFFRRYTVGDLQSRVTSISQIRRQLSGTTLINLTSALFALLNESLERLQVTRFVIAHRLSTIRNADRIYVLQAGRVVQQGRFEALANEEGLFAQLMARQVA